MVNMIPTEHTVPTEIVLATAASVIGDITDIQTLNDGNVLELQESGGTPGFDLHLAVDNVLRFSSIAYKAQYSPGSHWVEVQLFNYTTNAWDTYTTITQTPGMNYRFIDIVNSELYIRDSRVLIAFDHVPGGVASHRFFVDYVALVR